MIGGSAGASPSQGNPLVRHQRLTADSPLGRSKHTTIVSSLCSQVRGPPRIGAARAACGKSQAASLLDFRAVSEGFRITKLRASAAGSGVRRRLTKKATHGARHKLLFCNHLQRDSPRHRDGGIGEKPVFTGSIARALPIRIRDSRTENRLSARARA